MGTNVLLTDAEQKAKRPGGEHKRNKKKQLRGGRKTNEVDESVTGSGIATSTTLLLDFDSLDQSCLARQPNGEDSLPAPQIANANIVKYTR